MLIFIEVELTRNSYYQVRAIHEWRKIRHWEHLGSRRKLYQIDNTGNGNYWSSIPKRPYF